ncbi:MAG: MATE family efflux transporter [Clostridia bacterium]|nr:MATE family efflux transporter [Clostridia bacterium]
MATRDMTVGKPLGILLKFSLPMLLSMVFQQLYSIVDSIVIGQICGSEKFAAVSVSYPVTALFVAFASGTRIGASVVTSQLFGEQRMPSVRTSAHTAVISAAVAGATLSAIGAIGCEALLRLIGTDVTILPDARSYLWIYTAGVTFLFLYNVANGVFTALGDSLTPLMLLIVSSVLNVALDLILVGKPFSLGVKGAAWATFIAQGSSSIAALCLMLRRLAKLPRSSGYRLFDRCLLRRIVRIAVPSICQQSFVSIGQLFVQGAVNQLPVYAQSGYGAAFKVNIFTISGITTMSNALSSYTAQNTGACEWARIRQGRRAAMWLTWGFGAAAGLTAMIFAKPLMMLFVPADAEAMKIGQQFLWTVAPFYAIITVKLINDGVFRGTGAMKMFMASTFLDLGVRMVASYVLPPFVGAKCIWWALPIGWIAGTALAVVLYQFGKWDHAAEIRGRDRS